MLRATRGYWVQIGARLGPKCAYLGGSLRDVQVLAGHSALGTTQRYIECDT
jgi:hypothetical protein